MARTLPKFLSVGQKVGREIARQYYTLFRSSSQCMALFFNSWLLVHRQCSSNSNKNDLIYCLKSIIWIAILGSFYMLALAYFPMTEFWRLLLWDQMLFQGVHPKLNMVWFLCGLCCSFIVHRIYFYDNPSKRLAIELIVKYLLGEDDRFGQEPVMKVDAQSMRKLLKRCLLLYGSQYFLMLKIYYSYQVVLYIWENFWFFTTTAFGWLSLILIMLNGIVFFLYTYVIMMEFFLKSIIGILFTYGTFVRLRQVNRMLVQLVSKPAFQLNLNPFYRFHTEILLDIFEANRLYGPLLLIYMSIAVPTSAYQLMLCATKELPLLASMHCVIIVYYQVMYCFGFHMAAALYSKKIHACALVLLNFSAKSSFANLRRKSLKQVSQVQLRLRNNWKMALYIEKFHCVKRYGITYASFGLITFGRVFTFAILYSELLMYSYNLINY